MGFPRRIEGSNGGEKAPPRSNRYCFWVPLLLMIRLPGAPDGAPCGRLDEHVQLGSRAREGRRPIPCGRAQVGLRGAAGDHRRDGGRTVNTATIPVEMQERPNWVLWRVDFVDGKVPYQVNGGKAKSNDPTTWTTLDKAVARYEQGGFDGIGFVFSTDCGLVFVDF